MFSPKSAPYQPAIITGYSTAGGTKFLAFHLAFSPAFHFSPYFFFFSGGVDPKAFLKHRLKSNCVQTHKQSRVQF